MQSKLITMFTQLSLHYCRSNPKHSWRNGIKASRDWVTLIVLGLDILIRHVRVSPTQTAAFILLLLPFFFFFFWTEWLIIQTCAAEKKKQKSFCFTEKCLRSGIQAFINLGMTKHHMWEDQMHNQTIFTHIRWIFKQHPPTYTQCPTSHCGSI